MNAPLTQPTLTTSSAGLVFTYKYLDDTTGPSSQDPFRVSILRRALLLPRVNAGSRYRSGEGT